MPFLAILPLKVCKSVITHRSFATHPLNNRPLTDAQILQLKKECQIKNTDLEGMVTKATKEYVWILAQEHFKHATINKKIYGPEPCVIKYKVDGYIRVSSQENIMFRWVFSVVVKFYLLGFSMEIFNSIDLLVYLDTISASMHRSDKTELQVKRARTEETWKICAKHSNSLALECPKL